MKCEECSKKLRIYEIYYHPMLGNKHHFCQSCFDKVSENVEKWKKVISPYFEFFINGSSDYNINMHWNNLPANFIQIRKMLDHYWTEEEI